MKIIALAMFMTGCLSSPVTNNHWVDCNIVCLPVDVREACDHYFKGKGCKCADGDVIWLDEMREYD